MLWILVSLAVSSAASFLFYGWQTLTAERQAIEFQRYGIPGLRQFVGSTQLLGASGVLLGLAYAPLGVVAAVGLVIMMASGLAVRVRIGDSPRLMIPAAMLGALNTALAAVFAGY